MLPQDVLRVAESGIRSGQEIHALQAMGYQAFLIGESLMREANPGAALQRIIAKAKTTTGTAAHRS